jgi:hypothetical protein
MKQSAPWWIFPSWSVRRSQRPDFRFAADLFLRRSSVIAPMRPGPLFPLAHVLKFSHSLLPSAAAPVCGRVLRNYRGGTVASNLKRLFLIV